MTSRRNDPSAAVATALIEMMLVVAGLALVVAVKVLAIVAQPLGTGLGSLAGALRRGTYQLWDTAVVQRPPSAAAPAAPALATPPVLHVIGRSDSGDS